MPISLIFNFHGLVFSASSLCATQSGTTALIYASSGGYTECVAALIEAEAVIERDFLIDLGLPVHSVGVRMTEKEIEQDVKVHEKTYEQAMQAMTDLFVGPKLPKDGDLAARERRKAARKIFREGRAA